MSVPPNYSPKRTAATGTRAIMRHGSGTLAQTLGPLSQSAEHNMAQNPSEDGLPLIQLSAAAAALLKR